MVPGIEVAYLLSGPPANFPSVAALPQRGKECHGAGRGTVRKENNPRAPGLPRVR